MILDATDHARPAPREPLSPGAPLRAAITVYEHVRTLKLHGFETDWNELRSSFLAVVDGEPCGERLALDLLPGDGEPCVFLPLRVSPACAPAGYPAVWLPPHVVERMDGALSERLELRPAAPVRPRPPEDPLGLRARLAPARRLLADPRFAVTLRVDAA